MSQGTLPDAAESRQSLETPSFKLLVSSRSSRDAMKTLQAKHGEPTLPTPVVECWPHSTPKGPMWLLALRTSG
eukprot:299922-Chlamydomonas_euryale.AAC.1